MLMRDEKLWELVETLTDAWETKNPRQSLHDQLKIAIEKAERRGGNEMSLRLQSALEALKEFDAWWRLSNDRRTIETIEPAMRKCVEVLDGCSSGTGFIGSPENWQPSTLAESTLVADEHMRLYGIEYDSDGATAVSRKIATRQVADRLKKSS